MHAKYKRLAVRLLRYTRYKCGKLENEIVDYLYRQHVFGKSAVKLQDLSEALKLSVKRKGWLLDAVKRLLRRRIIAVIEPI